MREKHPLLYPLYDEIYQQGNRSYWELLNQRLSAFAQAQGLHYVRDDDSFTQPFDAPPVMVNFFYHEEIKKSAKKRNNLPEQRR